MLVLGHVGEILEGLLTKGVDEADDEQQELNISPPKQATLGRPGDGRGLPHAIASSPAIQA